jgi:hypothetical protein
MFCIRIWLIRRVVVSGSGYKVHIISNPKHCCHYNQPHLTHATTQKNKHNITNATMGSAQQKKQFPPGIHGPAVTFFKEDERQEIDWETQEKHLEFMVQSGLHGSMLFSTEAPSASTDSAQHSCHRRLQRREQLADRGREESANQVDSQDC